MLNIKTGFISIKVYLFRVRSVILTAAIMYMFDMKEVIKGISNSVEKFSRLKSIKLCIINDGLIVPIQVFIMSLPLVQSLITRQLPQLNCRFYTFEY
ncbi:hypothetical protein [Staphylococcus edaphicus]|uniref:Uncharacterized protein n=1 Tax=Staphylococcus edaphicus TaxID=1955013 RepID=A0A2C6WMR3_9STAP|nr:hypothetical protein [Staphylococcus edaphicus]PHK49046.1 hypothetical protein BTJ66_10505 [Staphylococcus edaphicus]UQW81372.1 hypothetical protein MNY58_12555 [Staphylococcus edaphicus]